MRKTHIASGILLTSAIVATSNIAVMPAIIGLSGSVAPDIDFSLGLKHRTLTHSLFGVAIAFIITMLFSVDFARIFAANCILHILMDSLTVKGVAYMYPMSEKFYGFKLFKTRSAEDMLICLVIVWIISEVLARI